LQNISFKACTANSYDGADRLKKSIWQYGCIMIVSQLVNMYDATLIQAAFGKKKLTWQSRKPGLYYFFRTP